MEQDMIFFAEKGLTDTKANQVANCAKLAYTELETEINAISFLNQKIESLDGTQAKDLSYGKSSLDDIPEKIKRIGDLKALCAWLREAIDAHQRVIKEAKSYTIKDYVEKMAIELPSIPQKESGVTEAEVIASFDIKKRNRYYALEAHAATVGQFIHKNGSIDTARKTFYEKLSNPRKTTGSGRDTVIYSYSPSVQKEEIEDLFYKLQSEHEKYQSELNAIKSEIKSRIANDEIDKSKEYDVAYKAYSEVNSNMYNKFRIWQQEEQKRVQALKIVIPNSLQEIYETVTKLGKK